VAASGARTPLKGSVNVDDLPPNSPPFTVTTTVTVKGDTVPGPYRLQACADAGGANVEEHEDDNCRSSAGTVEVTPQADLVVTSVTVEGMVNGVPLTAGPGAPVTIDAVVRNQSSVSASGPSTVMTMKYLLRNTVTNTTKNLKGTQAVSGPIAGNSDRLVDATVFVYSDTLPGTYTVEACIDSKKIVDEAFDSNNCGTAPGTVTVPDAGQTAADLTVLALDDPPANRVPGRSFKVKAMVKNIGAEQSDPSATRFWLVGPNDIPRKSLKGEQPIGPLAIGGFEDPEVLISIYPETDPGTYWLQACADGPKDLIEPDEGNNCLTSAGQIIIRDVSNLVVTALGALPTSVPQGQQFTASSTIENIGAVRADESSVKYYVVSAANGARTDLIGNESVPELLKDGVYTTPGRLVTVRPETPPGQYNLQACADAGKIIFERSEDDNCFTSEGTFTITVP
jgi:subtilase family serine protease